MSVCMYTFMQVPTEARGRQRIPWSWSYRQGGVLGMGAGSEIQSSARAAPCTAAGQSLQPLKYTFKINTTTEK